MSEYQITSWRDLPSMVVTRDGDEIVKLQLSSRLQEAIDEAAMRLGDVGSDAYLEGWVRSEWVAADADPTTLAGQISASLEQQWSKEEIANYLDGLTH